MENKRCLATIKSRYAHLTKKEKQLADYILAQADRVLALPTARLAQEAGVVPSVVVRLCQSLGFSGYTAFKLTLSRELARNEEMNFSPYIGRNDAPGDIFEKIFAANVKTLRDTVAALDRNALDRAVDILAGADRLYLYGIGTSAGIVLDFQFRLMQLGFTAFGFTDVMQMQVSSLNLTPRDAAIGVSNSGRTVATVEALHRARERGAKTVGVTSYSDSELVKNSDCPLVIATDEIRYPMEAISARIAHISLLDSLTVALSARQYERATQRAAQAHDLIDRLRY